MTRTHREETFTSLNLMQRASISKAGICPSTDHLTTPVQLRAYTLAGQRLPVPLTDDGGSWSFSLSQLSLPITHLVLEDSAGSELVRVDELMPRSDEEYEVGFRSAKRRPDSAYINFFIARQMVLHFPGTPSYRIAAAVVVLYKAVEIGDPEYLDWAEEALQIAEQLMPLAPVARSTRKNREHLRVSLWCAEWHLRLLQGDFPGFLDRMLKIKNYMETDSLKSYFNVAYPANASLLLLCLYFSAIKKRGQAQEVSGLTFELFKKSVRDADTTMAHFKELGKIHEATYECLMLSKRNKPVSKTKIIEVLQRWARIDHVEHKASFQKIRKTYLDGLGLS